MGLGGLFKKMLGGGDAGAGSAAGDPVEYMGFTIVPAPKPHGGGYVTAGRISKTGDDGSERVHEFIRADTHSSIDEARTFSTTKARQIIDQMGERIFDQNS